LNQVRFRRAKVILEIVELQLQLRKEEALMNLKTLGSFFRLFPRGKRLSFIFYFLILLPGGIATGHADAWWDKPHQALARNAILILPEPMKLTLVQHLDVFDRGVIDPDYNRVDNHKMYQYSFGGKVGGISGVHHALQKFAMRAEEMNQAGKPMGEVAFVLGQAAHFIQDLNVPLHTIEGETSDQHETYEGAAYVEGWKVDQHYYPGFYLIKNYKCFAYETATRSHKYFGLAFQNPPPRQVIEITWTDAINDVANLWQSIFYRALGPEKARELYGIPAPKGEKGKGWFCW
jgi:hypothetical protein